MKLRKIPDKNGETHRAMARCVSLAWTVLCRGTSRCLDPSFGLPDPAWPRGAGHCSFLASLFFAFLRFDCFFFGSSSTFRPRLFASPIRRPTSRFLLFFLDSSSAPTRKAAPLRHTAAAFGFLNRKRIVRRALLCRSGSSNPSSCRSTRRLRWLLVRTSG